MKLDLNAVQILNKEGQWTHDLPGNNFFYFYIFLFFFQFNISKMFDFTYRIPNIRNYRKIWIINFYYYCYETIMFGRVTHTLDAAAMRVRSFVYIIHIL